MGAWILDTDCKEGPEVQSSPAQGTSGRMILGQSTWDRPRGEWSLSVLEGSLLSEVSAFWVMCDPVNELLCLQETVASFGGCQLFTWATRISADEQPASGQNTHAYLTRIGRRAGIKKFPSMPFVESTYRCYSHLNADHYPEIEPLLHRNSGYALGIQVSGGRSDGWAGAAQLLEGHFSLAFDFENSPDLEALRRKLVTLYVSAAIEMGFMPLVPLNRHPAAGHVLFCHNSSYDAVAEKLGQNSSVLDGDSGMQQIANFLDGGGGLAYL